MKNPEETIKVAFLKAGIDNVRVRAMHRDGARIWTIHGPMAKIGGEMKVAAAAVTLSEHDIASAADLDSIFALRATNAAYSMKRMIEAVTA